MEIFEFEPKSGNSWDKFVSISDNGTIFQSRKFLSYHGISKFNDKSLLLMEKGIIRAVFPAVLVEIDGEKVLYSHRGASYGGLVVDDKLGLKDTCSIIENILRHAESLNTDRIIITQTPVYYYKKKSSNIDFALHINGFNIYKRELSSVLALTSTVDAIFKSFPDTVKRAVRKAEKNNLFVKESTDLEEFYTILRNNLKMRHDVTPTHSLDELKTLAGLYPDKIRLYAAYKGNKMAAGVVTFACNELVNLAFYIAHIHELQNDRPVDLVIWKVISESINQNFKYLDFGTFTLDMEPNWGLCRFKEKFGARGIFRDTFERRIS